MSQRITVRVDKAVYGRLSDAARARGMDVSSVVRQAVIADLDESKRTTPTAPPVHERKACAQTILAGCPLGVRLEVSRRLTPTDFSLADWLEILLWCSVAPFIHQATQHGVELSPLLHQALVMYLDRASRAHALARSPHSPEDCARVVLDHCPPAVQDRMTAAVARTGAPRMRLLSSIVQFWTDTRRNPQAWTPDR
jgi:Ribbon-helix-helix protein, copG family